MKAEQQLDLIKRLKAIAETGIVYSKKGSYDIERYTELKEISLQLMAHVGNQPLETILKFFMPQEDYPTPKVDVRGFVLNDENEILLAKESVDGKWSIPGGWADIGCTPSEVVIKEIEEETGLKVEVDRLLAVYDKQRHPHPPEPFYVYKMMFYCKVKGGSLKAGFDMLETGYFPLNNLPELSENRILESQLKQLYKMVQTEEQKVYID
ncbi:MAG: ADP-ribose pyrophosphatase [Flavobacteriaceae bacterium]|nr:MAG: ADP-ribose pyrophosphatase [Flavobacteriaceae bacterium]